MSYFETKRTVLHVEPHVETIDDFLDENTCTHFIHLAKTRLKQALVTVGNSGVVSKGRTGKNCWIQHDHDEITLRVAKDISSCTNVPIQNAEKFQIIYYDKSQEYRSHCDSWFHDGSDKAKRCMKYGGQRLVTALCYLNNVSEGGHTRFTKLKISVKPERGRLLIFHNVYSNTNKRHPLSEHAGCPVEKGEKWAFNLWFREDITTKIVYNPSTPVPENKIQYSLPKKIIHPRITTYNNVLTENDVHILLKNLNLDMNTTTKTTQWIQGNTHKHILEKIAHITKEPMEKFETLRIVTYPKNYVHGVHYDHLMTKYQTQKLQQKKWVNVVKQYLVFLKTD